MRPKVLTVTPSAGGPSHSPVYVVDHYNDPMSIGLAVTVSGNNGVYDVQHTFADPGTINLNTANSAVAWINHTTLTSVNAVSFKDATADSNYAHPPRAIRLRARSIASAGTGELGTLTLVPAGPST